MNFSLVRLGVFSGSWIPKGAKSKHLFETWVQVVQVVRALCGFRTCGVLALVLLSCVPLFSLLYCIPQDPSGTPSQRIFSLNRSKTGQK